MRKKSILILNRWDSAIACYEKYIDHNIFNVSYITNKKGASVVDRKKSDVCEIDNLSIECIEKYASDFLGNINNPDFIIALSEVDQEAAAYLRSKFSVSGIQYHEVKKFRDKVVMKNTVSQCGIIVPKYTDIASEDLSNFLKKTNFPLIFKPKNGVSSEGVIKINNINELLTALDDIDKNGYECEEFIVGKIYHSDGLIVDGEIIFCKVSEYINTCHEYISGAPLGSVIIDDLIFESEIQEYAKTVLAAFSHHNGAFHLEFIIDDKKKKYFIEMGARVGGAKVPYLFEKIFGINLIHAWMDIQLGNDISWHINRVRNQSVGGWLIFPEPRKVPCVVVQTHSISGMFSSVIEECLPAIGHIFKGNGEYQDVTGSYLLEGENTECVKNEIYKIINNFNIKTSMINLGEKYVHNNVER